MAQALTRKRIRSELAGLKSDRSDYFTAAPREDNELIWDVNITTDTDSKFGKVKHTLELILPTNYPFHCPTIRFITPIRHNCVDSRGYIYIDQLLVWSPAYTISGLIMSIASVLNEGDIDYLRSRQVARTESIKFELFGRIWAKEIESFNLSSNLLLPYS